MYAPLVCTSPLRRALLAELITALSFVCLFEIGAFSRTGVYTPHDEKNSMLSYCGEKRSQAHSVGPSSPLEDVTHTKWILFQLIVIMWHSSMESNTSYDSKVIAHGFGKKGYDSQPL